MPIAIANVQDTQRFDLKSVAEGYIVLKRMTYGQIVQRRAMTKLSIDTSGRSKDIKGELAMASREVTQFEFKNCIVEHNLEKADGDKLNLGSPVDFEMLDPRVGQEIEKRISEMNNFEDDDQEN
jgi:hypothetical protein